MGRWITKNNQHIYINGSGKGVAVAVAGLMLFGGAAGAGALGGAAGGAALDAAAESLAGNTAGDVVDSLPGRSLKARTKSGQESARKGDAKNAWSRLKFKELKRKVERKLEREADCLVAASGRVREFLAKTRCTSLDRMLLAVGDGHGNAAVVSVVRVGFKTKAQAGKFRQVETVQGSGDVRPLEAAVTLGLAGVRMTGLNYSDRPDGTGLVVAEADQAAGHVPRETLKALADVAAYLPVK
ncbi:hypothetical protein ABZU76_39315 [Amycolatopsis sp. NPDC005232]|uniref:hypothetical protein n=1 Tax=Amycolatopsis sp. NPDC005232 TaxID=3157027 RepID=UPI0033BAB207